MGCGQSPLWHHCELFKQSFFFYWTVEALNLEHNFLILINVALNLYYIILHYDTRWLLFRILGEQCLFLRRVLHFAAAVGEQAQNLSLKSSRNYPGSLRAAIFRRTPLIFCWKESAGRVLKGCVWKEKKNKWVSTEIKRDAEEKKKTSPLIYNFLFSSVNFSKDRTTWMETRVKDRLKRRVIVLVSFEKFCSYKPINVKQLLYWRRLKSRKGCCVLQLNSFFFHPANFASLENIHKSTKV